MTRFVVQRFDPDGSLRTQIEGERLRHFPDNDTLEVDDARRSSHEVVLGTDGQNPNLKQPMLLCVSSDFPLLMCLNALARQRGSAAREQARNSCLAQIPD